MPSNGLESSHQVADNVSIKKGIPHADALAKSFTDWYTSITNNNEIKGFLESVDELRKRGEEANNINDINEKAKDVNNINEVLKEWEELLKKPSPVTPSMKNSFQKLEEERKKAFDDLFGFTSFIASDKGKRTTGQEELKRLTDKENFHVHKGIIDDITSLFSESEPSEKFPTNIKTLVPGFEVELLPANKFSDLLRLIDLFKKYSVTEQIINQKKTILETLEAMNSAGEKDKLEKIGTELDKIENGIKNAKSNEELKNYYYQLIAKKADLKNPEKFIYEKFLREINSYKEIAQTFALSEELQNTYESVINRLEALLAINIIDKLVAAKLDKELLDPNVKDAINSGKIKSNEVFFFTWDIEKGFQELEKELERINSIVDASRPGSKDPRTSSDLISELQEKHTSNESFFADEELKNQLDKVSNGLKELNSKGIKKIFINGEWKSLQGLESQFKKIIENGDRLNTKIAVLSNVIDEKTKAKFRIERCRPYSDIKNMVGTDNASSHKGFGCDLKIEDGKQIHVHVKVDPVAQTDAFASDVVRILGGFDAPRSGVVLDSDSKPTLFYSEEISGFTDLDSLFRLKRELEKNEGDFSELGKTLNEKDKKLLSKDEKVILDLYKIYTEKRSTYDAFLSIYDIDNPKWDPASLAKQLVIDVFTLNDDLTRRNIALGSDGRFKPFDNDMRFWSAAASWGIPNKSAFLSRGSFVSPAKYLPTNAEVLAEDIYGSPSLSMKEGGFRPSGYWPTLDIGKTAKNKWKKDEINWFQKLNTMPKFNREKYKQFLKCMLIQPETVGKIAALHFDDKTAENIKKGFAEYQERYHDALINHSPEFRLYVLLNYDQYKSDIIEDFKNDKLKKDLESMGKEAAENFDQKKISSLLNQYYHECSEKYEEGILDKIADANALLKKLIQLPAKDIEELLSYMDNMLQHARKFDEDNLIKEYNIFSSKIDEVRNRPNINKEAKQSLKETKENLTKAIAETYSPRFFIQSKLLKDWLNDSTAHLRLKYGVTLDMIKDLNAVLNFPSDISTLKKSLHAVGLDLPKFKIDELMDEGYRKVLINSLTEIIGKNEGNLEEEISNVIKLTKAVSSVTKQDIAKGISEIIQGLIALEKPSNPKDYDDFINVLLEKLRKLNIKIKYNFDVNITDDNKLQIINQLPQLQNSPDLLTAIKNRFSPPEENVPRFVKICNEIKSTEETFRDNMKDLIGTVDEVKSLNKNDKFSSYLVPYRILATENLLAKVDVIADDPKRTIINICDGLEKIFNNEESNFGFHGAVINFHNLQQYCNSMRDSKNLAFMEIERVLGGIGAGKGKDIDDYTSEAGAQRLPRYELLIKELFKTLVNLIRDEKFKQIENAIKILFKENNLEQKIGDVFKVKDFSQMSEKLKEIPEFSDRQDLLKALSKLDTVFEEITKFIGKNNFSLVVKNLKELEKQPELEKLKTIQEFSVNNDLLDALSTLIKTQLHCKALSDEINTIGLEFNSILGPNLAEIFLRVGIKSLPPEIGRKNQLELENMRKAIISAIKTSTADIDLVLRKNGFNVNEKKPLELARRIKNEYYLSLLHDPSLREIIRSIQKEKVSAKERVPLLKRISTKILSFERGTSTAIVMRDINKALGKNYQKFHKNLELLDIKAKDFYFRLKEQKEKRESDLKILKWIEDNDLNVNAQKDAPVIAGHEKPVITKVALSEILTKEEDVSGKVEIKPAPTPEKFITITVSSLNLSEGVEKNKRMGSDIGEILSNAGIKNLPPKIIQEIQKKQLEVINRLIPGQKQVGFISQSEINKYIADAHSKLSRNKQKRIDKINKKYLKSVHDAMISGITASSADIVQVLIKYGFSKDEEEAKKLAQKIKNEYYLSLLHDPNLRESVKSILSKQDAVHAKASFWEKILAKFFEILFLKPRRTFTSKVMQDINDSFEKDRSKFLKNLNLLGIDVATLYSKLKEQKVDSKILDWISSNDPSIKNAKVVAGQEEVSKSAVAVEPTVPSSASAAAPPEIPAKEGKQTEPVIASEKTIIAKGLLPLVKLSPEVEKKVDEIAARNRKLFTAEFHDDLKNLENNLSTLPFYERSINESCDFIAVVRTDILSSPDKQMERIGYWVSVMIESRRAGNYSGLVELYLALNRPQQIAELFTAFKKSTATLEQNKELAPLDTLFSEWSDEAPRYLALYNEMNGRLAKGEEITPWVGAYRAELLRLQLPQNKFTEDEKKSKKEECINSIERFVAKQISKTAETKSQSQLEPSVVESLIAKPSAISSSKPLPNIFKAIPLLAVPFAIVISFLTGSPLVLITFLMVSAVFFTGMFIYDHFSEMKSPEGKPSIQLPSKGVSTTGIIGTKLEIKQGDVVLKKDQTIEPNAKQIPKPGGGVSEIKKPGEKEPVTEEEKYSDILKENKNKNKLELKSGP